MKATRNQNENRTMALKGNETVANIRERVEQYVREDPLKAVGQAAAAGFILRFLPLRSILMTGIRLAAPIMLLNRLWDYTSKSEAPGEPSRSETREKAAAR
jgi:hypothetical protein